jgi:ferredoxin
MKNKVSFVYKVKNEEALTDIIKKSKIDIKMPCKKGKCGKCVIKIEGDINSPTKNEKKLLSESDLEKGYRLACEVKILGDVKIKME